jgi:hypothetical protein
MQMIKQKPPTGFKILSTYSHSIGNVLTSFSIHLENLAGRLGKLGDFGVTPAKRFCIVLAV